MSIIEIVPLNVPVDFGEKTTLMLQLDPAGTLVPQLLVSENGPDAMMLEIIRGAVPEFVSVTG